MKKILSILLAACMFAAMASPAFASGIGVNGGGYDYEPEREAFDAASQQERITNYDSTYKVNDDGTFSSLREGKINRDNCLWDERFQVPYVVNLKLGDTIRIAYSPYISYGFSSKLVDLNVIQMPVADYYGDDDALEVMGICDYTAKAVGVYVSDTQHVQVGYNRSGIIWNITEDGSALTDADVAAVVAEIEARHLAKMEAEYQDTEPEYYTEETETTTTTDTTVDISIEGGAYTVKEGDTLGLLSLNTYGSYAYADELYKANAAVLKKSEGKIYKGLEIVIPQTIAKGVNAIAPATAYDGEKLYTVKSGDTLGTIAQAAYGNSNKYKAIFERNTDRIANVNTIYSGQVIVLPNA